MPRKLALIALLPLLLVATPASAITAKQKAETCKIGADDQKLEGAKRKAFLTKCLGTGNYQPKARKDALKKTIKKPATKKNATVANPPPAAANPLPPPPSPANPPPPKQ
jgi:hypothetical protein